MNPFELLLEQIRQAIRNEIASALAKSNGHQPPTLLSAETAAKLWDVPKTRIAEAARRGELPSIRLGHYVRFRPEDLKAFIEAHEKNKEGT